MCLNYRAVVLRYRTCQRIAETNELWCCCCTAPFHVDRRCLQGPHVSRAFVSMHNNATTCKRTVNNMITLQWFAGTKALMSTDGMALWIMRLNSDQFKWYAVMHLSCLVLPSLQVLINILLCCRMLPLFDICFYIWYIIIPMQCIGGCSKHTALSAKQQQGNVPRIHTGHVIFSTEKSDGPGTWLTDRTIIPSAAPSRKFTLLCDRW